MQYVLDWLVRNIMQLWPVARVYSWQQGLLVRCGCVVRELGPGLHWRWWLIDEVYTQATTEYVVELKTASITTLDGKSVGIGANLAYRIVSVEKLWRNVAYFADSVKNLALGQLTTECLRSSFQDLVAERDTLNDALVAQIRRAVAPWGVEITRLQLTHLVEAPAYQLLGDSVKVGS